LTYIIAVIFPKIHSLFSTKHKLQNQQVDVSVYVRLL